MQHPQVKFWVKLRKDRKERQKENKVLIVGKNLVLDLLQKFTPSALILGEEISLSDSAKGKVLYRVSEQVMKKITGLEEPDGYAAEFKIPDQNFQSTVTRLLVLDGLSDPGNLGTLIRSALALGWDAVFLLDGTVDPYNDKALRSAKGATFHLPFLSGDKKQLLEYCKEQELDILLADIEGNEPSNFIGRKRIALVLGNEARGISVEGFLNAERVSIKMRVESESLNVGVAGGILMYVLGGKVCE